MIPNLTKASSRDINQILKEIEKATGCELVITSGDRSKEHNRRVGGVSNSFHLQKDRARDIVPKDKNCISISQLAEFACLFTTTIKYSRHVHIDNRKKKICTKGSYKKRLTDRSNYDIMDVEIKELRLFLDEALDEMKKSLELNINLEDIKSLI